MIMWTSHPRDACNPSKNGNSPLRTAAILSCALMFLPRMGQANYIWEPRTQVTHADTSIIIDDIAAARVTTETELFHFTIENPGFGGKGAKGYLLTFPNDSEIPNVWDALWGDSDWHRPFFESSEGEEPDFSTVDHHIGVDDTGNVLLMYEAFGYDDFEDDEDDLASPDVIAFKTRSSSNWPQGRPIFATGGKGDPGGNYGLTQTSPHFFIQAGSPDTLHLTFQDDRSDSSHWGWMGYRRTPYTGPSDASVWRWASTNGGDISWVTPRFARMSYVKDPNGFVFVDPENVIHFFGEELICNEYPTPDSLRLLHLWGRPPSPGVDNWIFSSANTDTLDEYEYDARNEQCSDIPPVSISSGPGGFGAVLRDSTIYLAWNHLIDPDTKTREIYFTAIDTSIDPPHRPTSEQIIHLTENDSLDISARPFLAQAANGSLHLGYHDNVVDAEFSVNIYHMWVDDPEDALDVDSWSVPTRISVQQRTRSKYPHIFASHDSAWVVYMCHDDDDVRDCNGNPGDGEESDCDWEAWGQIGHWFPNAVEEDETMTWDGLVYLDADFTIPASSKLIITAGSKIFAKAGAGVQIICEGQIEAIGTEENKIVFSSFLGDGEEGEWDGITFAVEGCGCNGNGYSAGAEPLSRLENVVIENALYGVRIDNVQAPSLVNVGFEDITDDRHIYLTSDAFIPYGYFTTGGGYCDEPVSAGGGEWILLPGTNVVAASASSHDLGCIGEEDKVDLLVDGSLIAAGADEDSVYFRAENPVALNQASAGTDWGGIFFSYYSAPSSLEYASIGNAANPLYFYYAGETVTVEHSTIKHFADVGIWAYGCVDDDGPIFDHVNVDRGGSATPALYPTLGSVGVIADQADGIDLTASYINLEGHDDDNPAIGVQLYLSESLCHSPTGSFRTLLIEHNSIEGPGPGVFEGDDDVGLDAYWTCGGSYRSVNISENTIDGWKKVGMLYSYPESVQVECNKVINVLNGVDVDRGVSQGGASIKFRKNRVEATTQNSNYWAFRTNDALKSSLGPDDNALLGKNELAVRVQATKFIWERDSDASDQLNATCNYWFTYGGNPPVYTLLADSVAIKSRFAPTGWNINLTNFFTGPPSSGCSPPLTLHRQAQVALVEDDHTNADEGAIALEFSLGVPTPNPGREGISISFAVPAERLGEYLLSVYDVTGRRIHNSSLQVDSPGRFNLEWKGLDDHGRALGTGVYFLKLDGPGGIRETRKAVLVR